MANDANVVVEALSVVIPEPPVTEPVATEPPATDPPVAPNNGQVEKDNRTVLIAILVLDAVLVVALAALVVMIAKKKKSKA